MGTIRMAKIRGDDAELPAGWHVDRDNWGTRVVLPNDRELMKVAPTEVAGQFCVEDGMLCVMSAAVARYFDNLED